MDKETKMFKCNVCGKQITNDEKAYSFGRAVECEKCHKEHKERLKKLIQIKTDDYEKAQAECDLTNMIINYQIMEKFKKDLQELEDKEITAQSGKGE